MQPSRIGGESVRACTLAPPPPGSAGAAAGPCPDATTTSRITGGQTPAHLARLAHGSCIVRDVDDVGGNERWRPPLACGVPVCCRRCVRAASEVVARRGAALRWQTMPARRTRRTRRHMRAHFLASSASAWPVSVRPDVLQVLGRRRRGTRYPPRVYLDKKESEHRICLHHKYSRPWRAPEVTPRSTPAPGRAYLAWRAVHRLPRQ